jgi:cobalt-zinc-cadmium efflux system membrane fusion protein
VGTSQPLATFDNIEAGELLSQYQSAQAELERLKVQQAVAAKQAERNRRLAEIGAVPQKEYEISQAEQQALQEAIKAQESVLNGLRARLRRFGVNDSNPGSSSITPVRSPFAGVVIKAAVAPGETVDQGSELFQVADVSQLWVQAEVYEKDFARIRVGQMASVSVDTYPNEKFDAKVTYISDILDPQTRTAKVRCEVPNTDYRLKLDMFVSVSLPTTFSRKALAVPISAIQQLEKKNVVFVRKTGTKFEVREVKLGKEVEGRTEVVSGLREAELVVINGSFHLKSIVLSKELGEEE